MQVIAGYSLVRDLSGHPALILEITRDRDIYRYGLATWRQNAAAIFIFGLSVGLTRFLQRREALEF